MINDNKQAIRALTCLSISSCSFRLVCSRCLLLPSHASLIVLVTSASSTVIAFFLSSFIRIDSFKSVSKNRLTYLSVENFNTLSWSLS